MLKRAWSFRQRSNAKTADFARLVSRRIRATKSMLALTSPWRLKVSALIDVKKKILVAELLKIADIDYN
jgi:hypothetical protein